MSPILPPLPNGERFRWATYALYGCMALIAVSLVIDIQGWITAPGLADKPEALLDSFDRTVTVTGLLQFAALLTSGILFLRWWKRSLENLRRLGDDITGDLQWAVISWFVPIANFFVPLQFTQQMLGQERSTPNPHGWWAAWISGTLLSRVASKMMEMAEDFEMLRNAFGAYVLSDLLMLGAGFLLLPIMRFIQNRQLRLAVEQRRSRTAEPQPQAQAW